MGELRQVWWAPLLLIGLYILLCPLGLPASPLMFAGGAVFGAVRGTVYSYLGLLAAALIGYGLARLLGASLVHHLLGSRLLRIERTLARHGFWYLVGVRFLPIPFPLVNIAMALAGVRPLAFLVSTAIGLAPSVALWTYFADALYQAASGEARQLVIRLGLVLVLLVLVSLTPGLLQARARKRRYTELKAARSRR